MTYKLVLEIANKPKENDILVFKNGNWYCVERGISKDVLFTLTNENKEELASVKNAIKELQDAIEILKNEIKELKGVE